VSAEQWRQLVEGMRGEFRSGRFEQGLAAAIDRVDALLAQHFPLVEGEANPNELPDAAHLR
jgi:uncharacterized membrane protein